MRRLALACGVVLGLLAGCDKSSGERATTTATATTTTTTTTTASTTPTGSATPTSSASAASSAAGVAATYTGAFKTKVAQVVTPKDAHIKVWGDDPGTAMLGDGTITLRVTGSGDRKSVAGEAKGVLGDQTIAGELEGKTLQARVNPKDPNAADAMTGVLQGTLEGTAITATLRVANRSANVVREADVKLAPAP
jgi:hypothetical protein